MSGLLQYLLYTPCINYYNCKNHISTIKVMEEDTLLCDQCEEYFKHKRNRNYKILFDQL